MEYVSVTFAAVLPIYLTHPHSLRERPTNENTNGVTREYLSKGTEIPSDQLHLEATARELNKRPRQSPGLYTP